MKPLVCVYCEGNDTKVAVIHKEKDKLKLVRAASFDFVQPSIDIEESLSNLSIDSDGLTLEGVEKETTSMTKTMSVAGSTLVTSALRGLNLSKYYFIPALTEPAIYYHIFEGTKQEKVSKVTQEIIDDIQETKNVSIEKENLGYIELADKSLLSVFLSGEVSCINLINSVARDNGKRYFKIPAVKSAEVSLAYYVSKRKKFFPDDYSLIVYIGKEYSKLIFLHGRKLKHIGTTLDIGTLNLHTYDVYFSKILLEMENGGISSLDNIIVCGEDDSENLILSFYGTFPEANVSRLEFDEIDVTELDQKNRDILSAFSVPIAVANDYYDEQEQQHQGINLLPKYVRDEQKFFQFSWHGYAMLPLLFAATIFFTVQILTNNKTISDLNTNIEEKTIILRQNQEILNNISTIKSKISTFDQTQAILDSASVGTGVWTDALAEISNFFSRTENIWLTKLTTGDDKVTLEGYALSKNVLTDFAYSINSARLKSMLYEDLREKNAYKFNIVFNLLSYSKKTE